MKKAIAIARVSSPGQATEEKVSHDEQLRDIRAFAARENYKIVEEVREVESGNADLTEDWQEVRPLLADAWDKLKSGQVTALIFWDPSRFCRDKQMTGAASSYWVLASRKYGDGVRFVHDEVDRESDMNALLTMVMALGPALESKAQQRRFHAAKKRLFAEGVLADGDWPFGYAWDKKARAFEVVEEQAEIIRLIFRLYAGGGLTLRALARELKGHPTATGMGTWNPSVLNDILRRRCYASGIYHHSYDGKMHEIPCPTIIDQETFRRAQGILDAHRRNQGPRRKNNALLSGRTFCSSCKTRDGRPFAYYASNSYLCRNKRDGEFCPNPTIYRPKAERLVWGAVVEALTDRRSFTLAAEKRLGELDGEIAKLEASIPDLDGQIEQLKRRQARAEDLFIATGSERAKARAAELAGEMKGLQERKQEAGEEEESLRQLRADASWLRESICQGAVTISRLTELDEEQVEVWQDSGVMVHESMTLTHWETQIMTKKRLLDILNIKVVVYKDRLEITGAVEAVVGVSAAPTARR